eukprot:GHVR01058651.1.p1 GENE.GHVR01058651.1~~GHVR01058651.1.p1  ORF type:complete len:1127 (+),score=189.01 GHVR01058651.1:71-3451(+)
MIPPIQLSTHQGKQIINYQIPAESNTCYLVPGKQPGPYKMIRSSDVGNRSNVVTFTKESKDDRRLKSFGTFGGNDANGRMTTRWSLPSGSLNYISSHATRKPEQFMQMVAHSEVRTITMPLRGKLKAFYILYPPEHDVYCYNTPRRLGAKSYTHTLASTRVSTHGDESQSFCSPRQFNKASASPQVCPLDECRDCGMSRCYGVDERGESSSYLSPTAGGLKGRKMWPKKGSGRTPNQKGSTRGFSESFLDGNPDSGGYESECNAKLTDHSPAFKHEFDNLSSIHGNDYYAEDLPRNVDFKARINKATPEPRGRVNRKPTGYPRVSKPIDVQPVDCGSKEDTYSNKQRYTENELYEAYCSSRAQHSEHNRKRSDNSKPARFDARTAEPRGKVNRKPTGYPRQKQQELCRMFSNEQQEVQSRLSKQDKIESKLLRHFTEGVRIEACTAEPRGKVNRKPTGYPCQKQQELCRMFSLEKEFHTCVSNNDSKHRTIEQFDSGVDSLEDLDSLSERRLTITVAEAPIKVSEAPPSYVRGEGVSIDDSRGVSNKCSLNDVLKKESVNDVHKPSREYRLEDISLGLPRNSEFDDEEVWVCGSHARFAQENTEEEHKRVGRRQTRFDRVSASESEYFCIDKKIANKMSEQFNRMASEGSLGKSRLPLFAEFKVAIETADKLVCAPVSNHATEGVEQISRVGKAPICVTLLTEEALSVWTPQKWTSVDQHLPHSCDLCSCKIQDIVSMKVVTVEGVDPLLEFYLTNGRRWIFSVHAAGERQTLQEKRAVALRWKAAVQKSLNIDSEEVCETQRQEAYFFRADTNLQLLEMSILESQRTRDLNKGESCDWNTSLPAVVSGMFVVDGRARWCVLSRTEFELWRLECPPTLAYVHSHNCGESETQIANSEKQLVLQHGLFDIVELRVVTYYCHVDCTPEIWLIDRDDQAAWRLVFAPCVDPVEYTQQADTWRAAAEHLGLKVSSWHLPKRSDPMSCSTKAVSTSPTCCKGSLCITASAGVGNGYMRNTGEVESFREMGFESEVDNLLFSPHLTVHVGIETQDVSHKPQASEESQDGCSHTHTHTAFHPLPHGTIVALKVGGKYIAQRVSVASEAEACQEDADCSATAGDSSALGVAEIA